MLTLRCNLMSNLMLLWVSNSLFLPLELSEKAKQDLMEFEEQERQKRQNRYGGRGRGGRGARGRGGYPSFGMIDFRGGKRGRMNDHRPPLMGNMGKLVSIQSST